MGKPKKDIENTLYLIALLNLPLSRFPVIFDRRNHRQELILLLLFFAENNKEKIGYILMRDVFDMYGRLNWQDLVRSLIHSKYLTKDGHMGNYMLTDAGRAKAREIDKTLQVEYKHLRKLYKDALR